MTLRLENISRNIVHLKYAYMSESVQHNNGTLNVETRGYILQIAYQLIYGLRKRRE
jgi:hypothetical protein